MYDHQTDSLWSHLAGAAVIGPLKGEKLKPIQSMFTQWSTWKKLHPSSKVLSSNRGAFLTSARDPYESYYRSADTGIVPTRQSDKRIYPKEYVLGVILNGKAKAYPYSVLSRRSVVNDDFAAVPLLIVFDEETATGMIFTRKLDGKTLSFKKAQPKREQGLLLVDDQSGSIWQGLTGQAVQGPLKGSRLEALPITPSFWFGWIDHYPDTQLFELRK